MTMQHSDISILVSVAICTHRRADRVDALLASLERQTYSGADVEVVVVENDTETTGAVQAVFERHKDHLNLSYVLESSIGLSRARNTALRAGTGSYVAFLDDDAEADSEWLAALVAECRSTRPDVCGGPIYPLYRTAKPAWFQDRYATAYTYGEAPRWLCYGEWFGGGNLMVDRRLCLDLGGFRTDLGMTGKTLGYGEETEWLMRAWAKKGELRVRYAPLASIHHEVRPEKMSLRWRFKAAWAGGGSSALMTPMSRRLALWELLRSMIDLPKQLFFGLSFICSGGKGPRYWRQWAFEALYPWFWLFSRNWHAFTDRKRCNFRIP